MRAIFIPNGKSRGTVVEDAKDCVGILEHSQTCEVQIQRVKQSTPGRVENDKTPINDGESRTMVHSE